jgi:hypothetical protein
MAFVKWSLWRLMLKECLRRRIPSFLTSAAIGVLLSAEIGASIAFVG